MRYIYSFVVALASLLIKPLAWFNPKIKLFVKGRQQVFETLEGKYTADDQVIWFHAASLGEFEQGRPVIEGFKKTHPNFKVVLTFFSPSGYEVRKNYEHADTICYLPLDTPKSVNKFLDLVQPNFAVFIKYEFWPNYLFELRQKNIPTILVSGIFRGNQYLFKSSASWLQREFGAFSHFFVQDAKSASLLNSINYSNVTVCGDTRFDRVYDILKRDNSLNFIEEFKENSYLLVAGSTWKEDEDLLVSYINMQASSNEKFIIAPHNMNAEAISALKNSLQKRTVLYSEKDFYDVKDFQVFIIDTIGILTKIYSYADVAYVGGGYTKSGIHNILEPATFGIPIVIGPNYKKFNEAFELIERGGCTSINNQQDINAHLMNLREDNGFRKAQGVACNSYIKESLGASEKIIAYINTVL